MRLLGLCLPVVLLQCRELNPLCIGTLAALIDDVFQSVWELNLVADIPTDFRQTNRLEVLSVSFVVQDV